MSQALLWAVMLTLSRSIAIALLCVLGGAWCLPALRQVTQLKRAFWLLLLPLLMPPLVIGYAYSNVALSLIRHPVLNDLLYSLLLAMRFFPATLLLLYVAPPPPLSPSALHALKMMRRTTWKIYLTQGAGRLLLVAFALVFVLCFTEFEITSRMGCTSWTIWLFDAQVGGAPLSSTLKWLTIPGAMSLLVLAIVFLAMPRRSERQKLINQPLHQHIRLRLGLLTGWWLLSMTMCIVIPWLWVLSPAIDAMPAVIREMQFFKEIGYSALFAVLATTLVLVMLPVSTLLPRWVRWLCCLPGMVGSLMVGLVMLWVFQLPAFNALYDTPIPIVLSLAIIALPAGLILGPVFSQRGSARHMTWLTGLSLKKQHQTLARHLRWRQQHQGFLMLTMILLYITYHDLPASSLLSPPGMSPAVVRLYNLMHYGKYETLIAMVVLTYGLPSLGLMMLWLLIRGRKVPTHG